MQNKLHLLNLPGIIYRPNAINLKSLSFLISCFVFNVVYSNFLFSKKRRNWFWYECTKSANFKKRSECSIKLIQIWKQKYPNKFVVLEIMFFMQNNTQKKRILFLLLLFWHIMHLFFVKEQITIKMFFCLMVIEKFALLFVSSAKENKK